jgi:hypothetical protein
VLPFLICGVIMARKRTELEQERMTDANIERVIDLLEPKEQGVKPITKKDACQILGMSYNTTRLDSIIQTHKERKEKNAKRRAEKRGKPVTLDEVQFIIQSYLAGENISEISQSTFRGSQLIKQVLDKYSVPIRKSSPDYFKPELIPDGAVRDKFTVGEVVYSARYDSMAKINAEQQHPDHGWIYRIWLLSDRWLQSAYQPASELASLQHLRELGVNV